MTWPADGVARCLIPSYSLAAGAWESGLTECLRLLEAVPPWTRQGSATSTLSCCSHPPPHGADSGAEELISRPGLRAAALEEQAASVGHLV